MQGDKDVTGRVLEAELWGECGEIYTGPGLTLKALYGAYGTLYELEVSSAFALGRVPVILATYLPGRGRWRPPTGHDTEGSFLMHIWVDAEGRGNHDTSNDHGGRAAVP